MGIQLKAIRVPQIIEAGIKNRCIGGGGRKANIRPNDIAVDKATTVVASKVYPPALLVVGFMALPRLYVPPGPGARSAAVVKELPPPLPITKQPVAPYAMVFL